MSLIASAFAQDATTAATTAAAAPTSGLASFVPLILIFFVFYFLLIRPQQKKLKQHESMVKALKRGDKVVTGGGILGTVVKVEDEKNILVVEIAPDVKVRVNRSSVTELVSRTEPAE